MDMQWTSGGGIIEQQHTGDNIIRLDGARDGAVGNEVLRGTLERRKRERNVRNGDW